MSFDKGLRLTVYRAADGKDYSNGGITSKHAEVTLVGTKRKGQPVQPLDRYSRVFDVTDDAPAVVLVESAVPGLYGPHLEPLEYVEAHNTQDYAGPMYGGNYAGSSDSRVTELGRTVFGHDHSDIYPVHDRVESWEHYYALTSGD